MLGPYEIDTDAIDLNGSTSYVKYNDNWTRDLNSPTYNSDITVSFWVKPHSGSSNSIQQIIHSYLAGGSGSRTRQSVGLQNSGSGMGLFISHDREGLGDGILYPTGSGVINFDQWNHVVYSWQDSTNNLEIAINDSDQSASNSGTGAHPFPAGSGGVAAADTWIGRRSFNDYHFDGCIAEFWMKDVYYDVSLEENRRYFISANGKPQSLPTAPLVYLKGTSTTWSQTGSTSLGFQTLANITDCADSPSD